MAVVSTVMMLRVPCNGREFLEQYCRSKPLSNFIAIQMGYEIPV
jgi:hypothetical protein